MQPGLLPLRAPPVATRPTAALALCSSAAGPSHWDWQQPAAGDLRGPGAGGKGGGDAKVIGNLFPPNATVKKPEGGVSIRRKGLLLVINYK